jgi:hypothetical protein
MDAGPHTFSDSDSASRVFAGPDALASKGTHEAESEFLPAESLTQEQEAIASVPMQVEIPAPASAVFALFDGGVSKEAALVQASEERQMKQHFTGDDEQLESFNYWVRPRYKPFIQDLIKEWQEGWTAEHCVQDLVWHMAGSYPPPEKNFEGGYEPEVLKHFWHIREQKIISCLHCARYLISKYREGLLLGNLISFYNHYGSEKCAESLDMLYKKCGTKVISWQASLAHKLGPHNVFDAQDYISYSMPGLVKSDNRGTTG